MRQREEQREGANERSKEAVEVIRNSFCLDDLFHNDELNHKSPPTNSA